MPISSGAEGHIGVGVDKSIHWLPDASEAAHNCPRRKTNSYLERYFDTHPNTRQESIAGTEGRGNSVTCPEGTTRVTASATGNNTCNKETINEEGMCDDSYRLHVQDNAESVGQTTVATTGSFENASKRSSICTVL